MISHFIADSGVSTGWLQIAAAGIAVISYFLGCFNGAVVVSRFILQDDVRSHGSGNAGLTNFHRVYGGPLTLLVICADVAKALVAVSFSMYIASLLDYMLIPVAKYWAGMFCMLGHMYPVTFGFRGGKGILSGGMIAILIDWRVALVVWGGFIILTALTRYVSLGSCWAGFSFPFISWFVFKDKLILIMSIVMGGLILWRHRGNIVRLIKGTESKFSLHKKEAAPPAAPSPAPAEPAVPPTESAPETEPAESSEDAPEDPPAGAPEPRAGGQDKAQPQQQKKSGPSPNKSKKKGKSGKGGRK